ncbi:hypothetical protein RMT89_41995 [Streptomyces sp. P17]|nr:hypothetical protein [Streptomyces sp. P17]MDT9702257.1 hypothetical protein [Streptomyces sp. P17]
MTNETQPNHFSQPNWDGVSNHAACSLEVNGLVRWSKAVISRERLQHGGLSQADSAVLFWVAESAIAETIA